jgi:hypothetical protein
MSSAPFSGSILDRPRPKKRRRAVNPDRIEENLEHVPAKPGSVPADSRSGSQAPPSTRSGDSSAQSFADDSSSSTYRPARSSMSTNSGNSAGGGAYEDIFAPQDGPPWGYGKAPQPTIATYGPDGDEQVNQTSLPAPVGIGAGPGRLSREKTPSKLNLQASQPSQQSRNSNSLAPIPLMLPNLYSPLASPLFPSVSRAGGMIPHAPLAIRPPISRPERPYSPNPPNANPNNENHELTAPSHPWTVRNRESTASAPSTTYPPQHQFPSRANTEYASSNPSRTQTPTLAAASTFPLDRNQEFTPRRGDGRILNEGEEGLDDLTRGPLLPWMAGEGSGPSRGSMRSTRSAGTNASAMTYESSAYDTDGEGQPHDREAGALEVAPRMASQTLGLGILNTVSSVSAASHMSQQEAIPAPLFKSFEKQVELVREPEAVPPASLDSKPKLQEPIQLEPQPARPAERDLTQEESDEDDEDFDEDDEDYDSEDDITDEEWEDNLMGLYSQFEVDTELDKEYEAHMRRKSRKSRRATRQMRSGRSSKRSTMNALSRKNSRRVAEGQGPSTGDQSPGGASVAGVDLDSPKGAIRPALPSAAARIAAAAMRQEAGKNLADSKLESEKTRIHARKVSLAKIARGNSIKRSNSRVEVSAMHAHKRSMSRNLPSPLERNESRLSSSSAGGTNNRLSMNSVQSESIKALEEEEKNLRKKLASIYEDEAPDFSRFENEDKEHPVPSIPASKTKVSNVKRSGSAASRADSPAESIQGGDPKVSKEIALVRRKTVKEMEELVEQMVKDQVRKLRESEVPKIPTSFSRSSSVGDTREKYNRVQSPSSQVSDRSVSRGRMDRSEERRVKRSSSAFDGRVAKLGKVDEEQKAVEKRGRKEVVRSSSAYDAPPTGFELPDLTNLAKLEEPRKEEAKAIPAESSKSDDKPAGGDMFGSDLFSSSGDMFGSSLFSDFDSVPDLKFNSFILASPEPEDDRLQTMAEESEPEFVAGPATASHKSSPESPRRRQPQRTKTMASTKSTRSLRSQKSQRSQRTHKKPTKPKRNPHADLDFDDVQQDMDARTATAQSDYDDGEEEDTFQQNPPYRGQDAAHLRTNSRRGEEEKRTTTTIRLQERFSKFGAEDPQPGPYPGTSPPPVPAKEWETDGRPGHFRGFSDDFERPRRHSMLSVAPSRRNSIHSIAPSRRASVDSVRSAVSRATRYSEGDGVGRYGYTDPEPEEEPDWVREARERMHLQRTQRGQSNLQAGTAYAQPQAYMPKGAPRGMSRELQLERERERDRLRRQRSIEERERMRERRQRSIEEKERRKREEEDRIMRQRELEREERERLEEEERRREMDPEERRRAARERSAETQGRGRSMGAQQRRQMMQQHQKELAEQRQHQYKRAASRSRSRGRHQATSPPVPDEPMPEPAVFIREADLAESPSPPPSPKLRHIAQSPPQLRSRLEHDRGRQRGPPPPLQLQPDQRGPAERLLGTSEAEPNPFENWDPNPSNKVLHSKPAYQLLPTPTFAKETFSLSPFGALSPPDDASPGETTNAFPSPNPEDTIVEQTAAIKMALALVQGSNSSPSKAEMDDIEFGAVSTSGDKNFTFPKAQNVDGLKSPTVLEFAEQLRDDDDDDMSEPESLDQPIAKNDAIEESREDLPPPRDFVPPYGNKDPRVRKAHLSPLKQHSVPSPITIVPVGDSRPSSKGSMSTRNGTFGTATVAGTTNTALSTGFDSPHTMNTPMSQQSFPMNGPGGFGLGPPSTPKSLPPRSPMWTGPGGFGVTESPKSLRSLPGPPTQLIQGQGPGPGPMPGQFPPGHPGYRGESPVMGRGNFRPESPMGRGQMRPESPAMGRGNFGPNSQGMGRGNFRPESPAMGRGQMRPESPYQPSSLRSDSPVQQRDFRSGSQGSGPMPPRGPGPMRTDSPLAMGSEPSRPSTANSQRPDFRKQQPVPPSRLDPRQQQNRPVEQKDSRPNTANKEVPIGIEGEDSKTPRDRYGFKKATREITIEEYNNWNFEYTPYLERRRKKWVALMKSHNLLPMPGSRHQIPTKFPPRSDKVKRYIRKGIPPEWRGNAWFFYAGGQDMLAREPSLYKHLCAKAAKGRGYLGDTDREGIERDLHRTFPDNILFKPDGAELFNGAEGQGERIETPMVGALRRVLQAFAIHNPNIGYCQSLNFLAGMLLLFMDGSEEKAFVLLNVITNVHLPGVHAKVLEADVDIGVLLLCLQESMPGTFNKICEDDPNMVAETVTTADGSVADGVDSRPTTSSGKKQTGKRLALGNRLPTVSLVLTNWFMSLFVSSLPVESVVRVWDTLFYEGSKALFRVALTIFKTGEQEIKSIREQLEVFQVVQTIPKKLIDANALMEACYRRRGGFGGLSQDTIERRRRERREVFRKEKEKKDSGRRRGKTLVGQQQPDVIGGDNRPTTGHGNGPIVTPGLGGIPGMPQLPPLEGLSSFRSSGVVKEASGGDRGKVPNPHGNIILVDRNWTDLEEPERPESVVGSSPQPGEADISSQFAGGRRGKR